MASRLERLEQEAAQLEARLQQKRDRLRKEKRQADTRRKIVVGAIALQLCEDDPQLAAMIEARMSNKDRERVGSLVTKKNKEQTEDDAVPGQSTDPEQTSEAADSSLLSS